MYPYRFLAVAVLVLHFAWIVWVMLGCLITRNRPLWRWIHIASLVYGILNETLLWPCPLTIAEQRLQATAGITPYSEGFLIHYLERLIYPDVSQALLTSCALAVCLCNLGVYARRFRKRQAGNW